MNMLQLFKGRWKKMHHFTEAKRHLRRGAELWLSDPVVSEGIVTFFYGVSEQSDVLTVA